MNGWIALHVLRVQQNNGRFLRGGCIFDARDDVGCFRLRNSCRRRVSDGAVRKGAAVGVAHTTWRTQRSLAASQSRRRTRKRVADSVRPAGLGNITDDGEAGSGPDGHVLRRQRLQEPGREGNGGRSFALSAAILRGGYRHLHAVSRQIGRRSINTRGADHAWPGRGIAPAHRPADSPRAAGAEQLRRAVVAAAAVGIDGCRARRNGKGAAGRIPGQSTSAAAGQHAQERDKDKSRKTRRPGHTTPSDTEGPCRFSNNASLLQQ
jgi:hypothetical protein